MVHEIIKYSLPGGEEISILGMQSTSINKSSEEFEMAGKGEKLIEYASESFEKSLEKLKLVSRLVATSLKEVNPEELEVEFGITFTADAGVVISLGAEFNLKIKMTWKKEVDKIQL